MHYYGERCHPLYPPGSGVLLETPPRCPPHLDAFANTCHPLSITKGPAPRWPGCAPALPPACSDPAAGAGSPLPCRPLVQKCVVLYPEPCETTRLLPAGAAAQTSARFESSRRAERRVAGSLPPCAPRRLEPAKLRFPPCGLRYAGSCRGRCRSRQAAERSSPCHELRTPPGLAGGYSLPLRGVTECPPQQSLGQTFPRECLGVAFPQHRCSKGYPTQECGISGPPERRLSPGVVAGKGTKERPPQPAEAKGLPAQERPKAKSSSSSQHLSKARCLHARGCPRASHHPSAGAKRSGHSKKSRCASKWLW